MCKCFLLPPSRHLQSAEGGHSSATILQGKLGTVPVKCLLCVEHRVALSIIILPRYLHSSPQGQLWWLFHSIEGGESVGVGGKGPFSIQVLAAGSDLFGKMLC